MLPLGDGFIVGTSLKQGGDTFKPIDSRRAEEFMGMMKKLRGRMA
jgi:predicted TIM-barrel enzyme